VCAPLATFDPESAAGDDLPIDERGAAEMALGGPTGLASAYLGAADPVPVGDVTPANLVSAIVTEEGVLRHPFGPALAAAAEGAARRRTPPS
jgi:methylthioribose-1-phosphate isomerase